MVDVSSWLKYGPAALVNYNAACDYVNEVATLRDALGHACSVISHGRLVSICGSGTHCAPLVPVEQVEAWRRIAAGDG